MEAERPHGREKIREALLEAATALIAKHGVEGVTTRAIAHAAGVNHSLLNRHFGSKELLVTEVANDITGKLLDIAFTTSDDLVAFLTSASIAQSEAIRALMRIVLDTEYSDRRVFEEDHLQKLLEWFRRQEPEQAFLRGQSSDMKVYLLATLVLGGELIGPSIKKSLDLDDEAYSELRKRTYELVFARG